MDLTAARFPADLALPLLDAVHARLGTVGLDRIERLLRDRAADTRAVPYHPLQRTHLLHVPGLVAKPWHDPRDFAWTPAFEAAAATVHAEFKAVEAAGVARDSWEDFGKGWWGWPIFQRGEWFADTLAHAPVTAALLRSIPHTQGEFLFSELGAGGQIPLHAGGCNAVLSCHLALDIPPDCHIEVGGQQRTWQPGRVILFDDSFAHGCSNRSDQRRICLVWEVWHPGLTEVERAAVALLYERLFNAD